MTLGAINPTPKELPTAQHHSAHKDKAQIQAILDMHTQQEPQTADGTNG